MAVTNVYALLESRLGHPCFGEPFYVGLGTSRRPDKHIAQARSKAGHRNWRLQEVLAAHLAADVLPRVRILAVCGDKAFAGLIERRAIKAYGRMGLDEGGTLTNLAKGGQGPDADLMRLPEVRARNSAAQKALGAAFLSARGQLGGLAAARNPQNWHIKSDASKIANARSWADPLVRDRRVAAMRGKKKTPSEAANAARRANGGKGTAASNAAKAAATKARWADPVFRAAMAEKRKAAWQDPEKRARMLDGRSEGIAKSWLDPTTKARRIAGIKAAGKRAGERGQEEHD